MRKEDKLCRNPSTMKLDFDSLFDKSMTCLKYNGAHPFYVRNLAWFCRCFGLEGIFTLIFFDLIYGTVHYEIKNNDMLSICANGSLMVMYLVITFMLCVLLNYKETFCELINIIKSDYELAKTMAQEDYNIVLKYALLGRSVAKYWGYFVFLGALAFPGQAIYLMIYYTKYDEFRLVPLFPLRFPEHFEEFMGPTIQWCLSNFLILFFEFMSYWGYVGTVGLGPIFMLHACGQIEVVERHVNNLFPETVESSSETRRKVADVVKEIQHIYSFVEKIQTAFKVLYEVTLKGSSLIMPLMIFMIIESLKHGKLPVEFIGLTIGAIVLSSIPCYFSDKLLEKVRFRYILFHRIFLAINICVRFFYKGESLRESIYSSGWEKHWDKGSRNSIYLILTRTARPIVLRTMFRAICLDALTDVFKDAYSLFNLLRAAYG